MPPNLLELRPFRPELVDLLDIKDWALCEVTLAFLVIYLSFMQKKHDHNNRVSDILGFINYMSLVFKTSFAFAMVWDGVYVFLHGDSEPAKASATTVIALFVIAVQQTRDLLGKVAVQRIMKTYSAALFIGELPQISVKINPRLPPWVPFLVNTEEWFLGLMPEAIRRKSRH